MSQQNDNDLISLWRDPTYIDRYNQLYPLPDDEIKRGNVLLQLQKEDHLIDLGCGAGAFVEQSTHHVSHVTAVDLSLELLKKREQFTTFESKLLLIEKNFLDIFPDLANGPLLTKAYARASLHHLTLEEKKQFFIKIKEFFRPGSLFLLSDVIFDFPKEEIVQRSELLMLECQNYYGDLWPQKRDDVVATWFKEFPEDMMTWTHVLSLAGFSLVRRIRLASFISIMLFKKDCESCS